MRRRDYVGICGQPLEKMIDRNRNNGIEEEQVEEHSPFVLDLRKGYDHARKAASSGIGKLESYASPDFLRKKKKKGFFRKIRKNISKLFKKKRSWKNLEREAKRAIFRKQAELAFFARSLPTLKKRRFPKLKNIEPKNSPYSSLYHALLFLSFLIIIILPLKIIAQSDVISIGEIKSSIISRTKDGIGSLSTAYQSAIQMDLSGARHNFSQAGKDFLAAKSQINDFHQVLLSLASLSGNSDIKIASQGRKFLDIASLSASLGETASMMASSLFETKGNLSAKLSAAQGYAQAASVQIGQIESLMREIDINDLPPEFAGQFSELGSQAEIIRDGLESFASEAGKLGDLLGADMDRRYLLVFENNSEMRGAGGFAGSFALVDVSQGKISNIEVPPGGSYDTEAGMLDFIKSPYALQLLSPRLFFWDSNWWPDWPTSARNMMYMYEKSGGPTVDGVIAVTPTVIERLLSALGPITLDDGTVIDKDNFWQYLQVTVEQDNIRESYPDLVAGVQAIDENKPKKIIGDLADKMIEEMPGRISRDNLVSVIKALEDSLEGKDLMFYFSDKSLEDKVASYNWGGEMRKAPQDYLMVAHTNLGGQKTDRVMDEVVSHQTQIASDGSIVDNVTITRTHKGIKGDAFTGVRNVDWLRVYVPEGSTLLSASGFSRIDQSLFEQPGSDWLDLPDLAGENASQLSFSNTRVYKEDGFQVFANWVMTDPGETSVVRLSYKLPFAVSPRKAPISLKEEILSSIGYSPENFYSYSLLWQKQPGITPACVNQYTSLPKGSRQLWTYQPETKGCQPLSGDKAYAIIFN